MQGLEGPPKLGQRPLITTPTSLETFKQEIRHQAENWLKVSCNKVIKLEWFLLRKWKTDHCAISAPWSDRGCTEVALRLHVVFCFGVHAPDGVACCRRPYQKLGHSGHPANWVSHIKMLKEIVFRTFLFVSRDLLSRPRTSWIIVVQWEMYIDHPWHRWHTQKDTLNEEKRSQNDSILPFDLWKCTDRVLRAT